MTRTILILSISIMASGLSVARGQSVESILIDDFESYEPDGLPTRWKYLDKGKVVPVAERHMRDKERFYVVRDGRNTVLRVYTEGEAVHLTMANEPDGFDWDIRSHPRLAWDWRVNHFPPGAREDREDLNDTAAGLYVIFAMDGFLIKRPRAIKYAYSANLPVGTMVSYGKLKVIVVSSALDGEPGWIHVDRDVVQDYERAFGGTPPERPLSIRLWSDSDNTRSMAEADFDNLEFLGQ